MIKEVVSAISLCVLLFGCMLPSTTMNRLSLGMTKPQVIKAIGTPVDTSAEGNEEILHYYFKPGKFGEGAYDRRHADYFVRLSTNHVTSFGRWGQEYGTEPTRNIRTGTIKERNP